MSRAPDVLWACARYVAAPVLGGVKDKGLGKDRVLYLAPFLSRGPDLSRDAHRRVR